MIDWNFDEARSRITRGYGVESITHLRLIASGLTKRSQPRSVTQKMRELSPGISSQSSTF